MLDDVDQRVRAASAGALGHFGKGARESLSLLQTSLKDKSGHVRVFAAKAVCQIEPGKEKETVVVLVAALKDPDPKTRCEAAMVLGQASSEKSTAATALANALKDGDNHVRSFAMRGLWNLRTGAKSALPDIINTLKHASPDVRKDAAMTLFVVQNGGAAVPALIDLLKDADAEVRAVAAQALGLHGNFASSAIPSLSKCLKDDNEKVRNAAASAIDWIRDTK
jgi:HEAT repeat protein